MTGTAVERTWRIIALLEVAAMSAILLSYIWGWHGAFSGASIAILVLYFGLGIASHLLHRESARDIGLRVDNFPRALRNAAMFVVPAVAVSLAVSWALGSWHFQAAGHSPLQALWLIAWATAQQYGLLCFFYRRFLDIFGTTAAATVGAAVSFAAFHLPNPFLFPVTLAAGMAACTLYRREANLFAIGLAHASVSFVLLWSLPYSVTHGLRVGPGYLALP